MRLRKNGSQISPDFLTKTAKRMLPTGQGLREATDEWNEKVIKKGDQSALVPWYGRCNQLLHR